MSQLLKDPFPEEVTESFLPQIKQKGGDGGDAEVQGITGSKI